MKSYKEFLATKKDKVISVGFDVDEKELNNNLFPFQKAIVKWALKRGRCAIFEDTGLGKTLQQLEWAYQVNKHINQPVLILAPLAVSQQTKLEGKKFGIDVKIVANENEVINGINITNYEKLHNFENIKFGGIVLDESSIIKSNTGKTTMLLIKRFSNTPYKLCCSATPSPNDYTEIGTHSEFLNIMRMTEMLSMFFINDVSNGNGWRLKKHCKEEFFKWMATWSIMISNPSDIGFDGNAYNLPKLNINTLFVKNENVKHNLLGAKLASTLDERRFARKDSINNKVIKIKELVNNLDCCLIWCDYNDESTALKKAINQGYEIKGSDDSDYKEKGMIGFANGTIKYLISKPSICGFGMNWQNCNNIIFCGLSDSYEQFYQAIRRCWRFGQTKEVNVYIIISESELTILDNIKNKQNKHNEMRTSMIEIMSKQTMIELNKATIIDTSYEPKLNMILPKFLIKE